MAAEIGEHALPGDVSREDDVARWFEQAGPVDLLVNNAGVQGPLLALATGRFDALAGRYLHAEHDSLEVLRARIEEIEAGDLNAICLRR